jgi:transposase
MEQAGTSGGKAKRRRWSAAVKRRIVAQSYEPGTSVAQLARRYELNDNQIFNWRREFKATGLALAAPAEPGPISFALIDVAADTTMAAAVDHAGRMEIELASGARVRVGSDVSEPALVRVLSALKVAL